MKMVPDEIEEEPFFNSAVKWNWSDRMGNGSAQHCCTQISPDDVTHTDTTIWCAFGNCNQKNKNKK